MTTREAGWRRDATWTDTVRGEVLRALWSFYGWKSVGCMSLGRRRGGGLVRGVGLNENHDTREPDRTHALRPCARDRPDARVHPLRADLSDLTRRRTRCSPHPPTAPRKRRLHKDHRNECHVDHNKQ